MVTRDVFQLELQKRNVVQSTIDPVTGRINLSFGSSDVILSDIRSRVSPADFLIGLMPRLRASRLRGASSPPRVLIQGHSNVVGQGGGTGTNGMVDAREHSWPVQLGRLLGWQTGSFFGSSLVNSAGATYTQYDPRVVTGSFDITGYDTFGGKFFRSVGASSSDLVFTPESTFDELTIHVAQTSNLSSNIAVKVDGNLMANIDSKSGTEAMKTTVISCPANSGSVSIANLNSDDALIIGVETRNTQSSSPVLIVGAACGVGAGALLPDGYPWSWKNVTAGLNPDVVATQCAINDVVGLVDVEALIESLAAINIAANTAGADTVNLVEFPFNSTKVTNGYMSSYADAARRNASSINGSFADARAVCGCNFATAQSLGYAYDSYHTTFAGNIAQAALFAGVFA